MNSWVLIVLLIMLIEVWWFGAHCIAYLSDIRDSLAKIAEGGERSQGSGQSSSDRVDSA